MGLGSRVWIRFELCFPVDCRIVTYAERCRKVSLGFGVMVVFEDLKDEN